MDTRTINSYQDLSMLALMLKSIAVGNKEELRSQEKRREDRYQREDRSRVKCYKCNRFGHCSYECRSKGSEESQKGIMCYSCDQPGHKSPGCPKKNNKQGSLNLTPGEKPKFVNWVAVTLLVKLFQGKLMGLQPI